MYLFSPDNQVVAPRYLSLHSQVLEGRDYDLVVEVAIVNLFLFAEGGEETEASVPKVVVDRAPASLPARQEHPIILHVLHLALLPRVLVLANYDGGAVPPQEERRPLNLLDFEEVLFEGEVEVDVVAVGVEDADGGLLGGEVKAEMLEYHNKINEN